MRFSYLFSAFLATLAVANPIASPKAARAALTIANPITSPETAGAARLAVRAPSDSPEWEEVTKLFSKQKFKNGDWVWFTMEWTLGSVAIGDDDKESKEELTELRKELGFDHIGIIIGEIIEKDVGIGKDKGKGTKMSRKFSGNLYHAIKDEDGSTELKHHKWEAKEDAKKELKVGKKTTSNKAAAAIKETSAYFDVASHKRYAIKGNNCNDFVKAIEAKL
ncbi:hypothetical protein G7Y89_g1579 [Cudoniella acicularis]|uniref:Uncharacterized protein n=1 Tax=Cudoniella acicularis TaxID=354080 RepID=A0A8H4WA55_9HELO|nr:hypothetical protein G7Y89_g1579 [Cudoniella acicularis]